MNFLPWVPQVVIIDAMFMINMKPLRRTTTILDYSKQLFNQYALEHYKAGTNKIHLIFDKPAQYFNPKKFEHVRRFKTKTTNSNHEHVAFTPDTNISQRWRDRGVGSKS